MLDGKKLNNDVDMVDKMSLRMFLKDKSDSFQKPLHNHSFVTILQRTMDILATKILKVKMNVKKGSVRTEK